MIQQHQSQLIERRKLMMIAAVELVAGVLWDSSNEENGTAMAASSGFTDSNFRFQLDGIPKFKSI